MAGQQQRAGDPAHGLAASWRLGIETVFSIADALRRIEQMVAAPPKPGLVSRLRNVMGI